MTPSGGALIAMVVAASFATVLIAVPRPVPPLELPPLDLSTDAVRQAELAERSLASKAPSGPAVDELRRLYEQQGEAEAAPGEAPGTAAERRRRLGAAREALVDAHGADGLRRLRAQIVREAMDAIEADTPANGLLGTFPSMLERYGLLVDGARIAPPFVLRVLYKARWNAIVGLELVNGFSQGEHQAYWGWLALHATGAPAELRADALERYAEAGGRHADEARGVMAFGQGRYGEALTWLAKAHARSPSMRLRNHQMAASLGTGGAP